jgi:hypothetical protein
MTQGAWRVCFVLGAVLISIGGPQHPRGTMVEMLHDPKWVSSHAWILAGFAAVLIGLWLFGQAPQPERTRRWVRLALIGTVLQTLEMAVHMMSSVDHANLVAGRSTPVLWTHLVMAVVIYPLFAASMIGLMLTAARERTMGSRWVAWIGILGALGHGLSAPLVVALNLAWARMLFPMIMLYALWLLLAAVWPVGVPRQVAEA